jgi:hypothetical protein
MTHGFNGAVAWVVGVGGTAVLYAVFVLLGAICRGVRSAAARWRESARVIRDARRYARGEMSEDEREQWELIERCWTGSAQEPPGAGEQSAFRSLDETRDT